LNRFKYTGRLAVNAVSFVGLARRRAYWMI